MSETIPARGRPTLKPDASGGMAARPAAAESDFAALLSSPATAVAEGTRRKRPKREFLDVWSRTQPKYRARAIVLLIVNFLLFCGLCIFTHWLHVARAFDFSVESYTAPFRFWGPQAHTLYDFVLAPISVEQTPMHGIVLGLLVASIVGIPICISILYRFPFALPFIAAVAIFAHLPWMAVTLTASCILASVPPFRLRFRFASALLAMGPVLLYLYLATRGGADPLGASASPDERFRLNAPWFLAIVASCLMMGLILLLARLVNYRPGVVSPVIAVMFATPVLIFHTAVGADELGYRAMLNDVGPFSPRFKAVSDASDRIRAMYHRWTAEGTSETWQRATIAVWSDDAETRAALRARVLGELLEELHSDRRYAAEVCRDFIADYPQSRYVPNVLYMQGRALDTRLDERKLDGPTQVRELYWDFPHVQSEDVWATLWNNHADSPFSIAAGHRLAQLRLRKGDVAGALELLTAVLARVERLREHHPVTQPARRGLLDAAPRESGLGFDAAPFATDAEQLRELLLDNRGSDACDAALLAGYAGLDSHRAGYRAQLLRLAQRSPDCPLHDDLIVAWADISPDPAERLANLSACIGHVKGEALARALLRLGELEMSASDPRDDEQRLRGAARIRQVADTWPGSSWGRLAAARLLQLQAPLRRAEGAAP